MSRFLLSAALGVGLFSFVGVHAEETTPRLYSGRPLNLLLVTGGCCHNYPYQSGQLTNWVARRADARFTVVHEGGSGTRGMIPLYDNPRWSAPYDVVVHNECFADTDDPAYIRRVVAGHRDGTPAVVVHCAMHTYRAASIDDWREFLGVTSRRHDHQSRYPVTIVAPRHPAMAGFKAPWTTAMDELYIVEKLWPKATALATARSERDGSVHAVAWANDFHGTRVFGTTFGHSDATFGDPAFLEMVARGIVWASGKADDHGLGRRKDQPPAP